MNDEKFWGARVLDLVELARRSAICSPDSKRSLSLAAGGRALVAESESFPIIDGCPVLYPARVQAHWEDGSLPLCAYEDPLLQYCLLSQLKNVGETNAPWDSAPVLLHYNRLRQLAASLEGWVLDVGCGSPRQSGKLLPWHCEYTGVDPYGFETGMVRALSEILPFHDETFDAVLFNTSLDHILDYVTALNEAHRVLKPGGQLLIASLAWTDNFTLLTDNVHFHHFSEGQILDALHLFSDVSVTRFPDPKGLSYRFGMYLLAKR